MNRLFNFHTQAKTVIFVYKGRWQWCRLFHANYLDQKELANFCIPHSVNGERYFQFVIDNFSHFTVVHFLKNKSEATENLVHFMKSVEAKHNTRVHRVRCDNGKEFQHKKLINRERIICKMHIFAYFCIFLHKLSPITYFA